jgi:hypothetical protein
MARGDGDVAGATGAVVAPATNREVTGTVAAEGAGAVQPQLAGHVEFVALQPAPCERRQQDDLVLQHAQDAALVSGKAYPAANVNKSHKLTAIRRNTLRKLYQRPV